MGHSVIVTGAARGIGAVIAEKFTSAGAFVLLADVDRSALTATADRLGGVPVVADVSEGPGARAVAQAALKRWGRIDVLVNNAASYVVGPVHELTEDAWDRSVSHVLTPVFMCCRAALPGMVARGTGSIVNIASVNHRIGAPHHGAYAAAKGGVVSLTRQLAVEYGPAGIRVNSVSPGSVASEGADAPVGTDAYPLRRFARADEVASAVLFLASEAASFITGIDLAVDGGLTAVSPAAVISPHLRQRWRLPPVDAVEGNA